MPDYSEMRTSEQEHNQTLEKPLSSAFQKLLKIFFFLYVIRNTLVNGRGRDSRKFEISYDYLLLVRMTRNVIMKLDSK